MVRVNSLAYMFLLAIVSIVIGSLLFLAFDETLAIIFDRPDWRLDPAAADSRPETADDVARGQRTLETLWAVVPVIGIVAIGFAVLAQARRAGG
jgi:hypothetical protein